MRISILMVLLSVTGAAAAQVTDSPVSTVDAAVGWTAGGYTMDVTSRRTQDYAYEGAYAFGTVGDGQQVMFTCSDRNGLSVAVFLEPKSIDDVFRSERKDLTLRHVALKVEGMEARADNWAYSRSDQTLGSLESWQAKRFFNAMSLGKPVVMNIRKVGKRTINLPPIDDAFRQFMSQCAVFDEN